MSKAPRDPATSNDLPAPCTIQAASSIDDFFKESLDRACVEERAEISVEARAYLTGLLADFVRPDGSALGETLDRPLTLLLDEALQSPASERFERLKSIGDGTLYVSGFFGDHLEARGVDDELVATIGGFAYGSAASMLRVGSSTSRVDGLFGELARKFRELVRLLTAVAENTCFRARSNGDALKLYERWLRKGDERSARELASLGLVGSSKAGLA
ncbi:MAG: hypothetical protein ACHREM_05090 [Polyangiales bacterium]